MDDQSLKLRLGEYIKTKTEFSAIDIDSSNISQMLDTLLPIAKQMIFYNNMGLNEQNLQNSNFRKNTIARAKELGYQPFDAISATGSIIITTLDERGTGSSPATAHLIINPNDVITVGNEPFIVDPNFTSIDHTLEWDAINGVWKFNGTDTELSIPIIQGTIITKTYYSSSNNTTVIDDKLVRIQLDDEFKDFAVNHSFTVNFVDTDTPTNNISFQNAREHDQRMTDQSEIYWMKDISDKRYLEFNNGEVGKSVELNDSTKFIEIVYLVSDKTDGNINANTTAAIIGLDYTFGNTDNLIETNSSIISGGRDYETMNEIKANAPLFYNSANRCVIDADFTAVLTSKGFNSSVWGGEYEYSRVYEQDPASYIRIPTWHNAPANKVIIGQTYSLGDIVNVDNKTIFRSKTTNTLTDIADIWDITGSDWEAIASLFLGSHIVSAVNVDGGGVVTQYNSAQYATLKSELDGKKMTSTELFYIDACVLEMIINLTLKYKQTQLVVSTVQNAQIRNFVEGKINDDHTGYSKDIYISDLSQAIKKNFNSIGGVDGNITIKLMVEARTDVLLYLPHAATIDKRVLAPIAVDNVTGIAKMTIRDDQNFYNWSVSSSGQIMGFDGSTTINFGIVYPNTGLIQLNTSTVVDAKNNLEFNNIRFDIVLSNNTSISATRELYLKLDKLNITSQSV